MAILKPDKTKTLGGVTVNEFLLTKHNPRNIAIPSVSMEGKIIGVTIHFGIVKKCAVRKHPKSKIGMYQAT